MASTAFVVSYVGARPVFIDSEPDTGNLDPDKIEFLITPRTKAIIPVHLYGTPCNLDAIHKIADKYHLHVVEDAAEPIGAKYKNRFVGSINRLTAFSLYANKVVTTGQNDNDK